LCRQLGVNYVHLAPDLVSRRTIREKRASGIDQFLEVMDNPANHPVLLHCRAGLHRTGVLVAIYRMEYQGWSKLQAMQELKDMGFGEFFCSSANDYVQQYLFCYQPGIRRGRPADAFALPHIPVVEPRQLAQDE
jgi:tyrosine-protein phosphatase SIW14